MTNSEPVNWKGEPVTDEVVESLAAEAEAGYEVPALKRAGGRKPLGSAAARVIPVRLDPELEPALRDRAEAEHSNASDPGGAPRLAAHRLTHRSPHQPASPLVHKAGDSFDPGSTPAHHVHERPRIEA